MMLCKDTDMFICDITRHMHRVHGAMLSFWCWFMGRFAQLHKLLKYPELCV